MKHANLFVDEAELEVRRVEASWTCPQCAREIAPDAVLRCEPCGRAATLSGGDELVLERIEMEVP